MADTPGFGRRSVLVQRHAAAAGAASFEPADEKYAVETLIGEGGMGEVLLVEDRDLKRQVAMKVLRRSAEGDEALSVHFLAEAQATSQLEHPGVPPVHDLGITPDGRLYFTMKLVRGRTLREVLHDLVLRRRDVQREYSLHRLVTIVTRIAETLEYAHERGVVHRDVKPENVMLGDYGEVHLMDWGLARIDEGSPQFEDPAGAERVATAGRALHTQLGDVKGTLPYMSPEQVRGDTALDGRTDIYSLGCVLYEMLTLQPAFDFRAPDLVDRVVRSDVVDVANRNPRFAVPPALAQATRRAMAPDVRSRYATAEQFANDLQAWLDGSSDRARRHEEAEALAAKGRVAAEEVRRLGDEIRAAERVAEAEADKFEPWQSLSEQGGVLAARARVVEMKTARAMAFAEATQTLHAGLIQEEENATARNALCELWKARLEGVERRGETAEVAHALAMIRRYDDGRFASFIAGDGTLSLSTDPPGAEVVLHRFVEEHGVLRESDGRPLGTTPIERVPLAMGSYLCLVRRPGFREVRYPVHVTRSGHWDGRVRLRTGDEIGEGFVFVPGGPFRYGEGKDMTVRETADFAIQSLPVTFGEYAEFLAAVESEHGQAAAADRMPRTDTSDGKFMERGTDGVYRPAATVVAGEAREFCLRMWGEGFEMRLPILAVTWEDAVAYCAWKSRTTGRTLRLPTEVEREKAARGVDGRRYPWGEIDHPSLAKCFWSRAHSSQPEPVGAFETAVSVYGMADAAGSVWDWTDSWYDKRRVLRARRGGSWICPTGNLRCANRYGNAPSYRNPYIGFRCATTL